MLQPYRSILSLPGALRFSATGLLARMEIAMVSLGSVLLVQATTGSYAIAGGVAATLGVASAVVAPFVARTVDRVGQAVVLRVAVVLHAALLVVLVVAAEGRWALPLVFLVAALAGATQLSVGALVRARWALLLSGTPRLQTAFALESVLDEVVFVVGPVVVTLLATLVTPALGPLLAAATALVGGLLLSLQSATQPPLADRSVALPPEHRGPLLRMRGLTVLVLVFLGAGGIFGASEVSVAAVTKAAGAPALAGLVLSLWAVGSMVSGIVYGAVAWRSRVDHRFVVLVGLLALTTVPMLVAPVWAQPVVFLLAGVVIAPTITTGTTLVESLVPRTRLTEGLAWTNTGLSLTYALAAAGAGAIIDGAGAQAGFLVPLASGVLAAAAAVIGLRRLRPVALLERAAV